MHGNVWEWCLDGHHRYDARDARSGSGLRGSLYGARDRVVRGGSFYYPARDARSVLRGRYDPGFRISDLGFRPRLATKP